MHFVSLIIKCLVAAACLAVATQVRAPFTAKWGPWLPIVLVAIAGTVAAVSLGWRKRSGRTPGRRLDIVPFVMSAATLLIALGGEARFQYARWLVLSASPDELEPLGRHVIVGYRDAAFVRALVERRAIGGIFLTDRNVAGRDVADIAHEIGELQAIRAQQGLAPLWVASDQEGGIVSRLSPPLKRQPALSVVVRGANNTNDLRAAVAAYAAEQGRGLDRLGINVNFAPVVDLDFGMRNPNDAYTRISARAIAADPAVVADVAGWYCDELAVHGVRCTLKHFPGLGRVFADTHQSEGVLSTSLDDLEKADGVPFRRLLGRTGSLVMVGHVRLAALDANHPVSMSRPAITDLLRGTWGYDGLIVTDDLCMGAIYYRGEGIGRASLRALNAGVDLLLLSWDGEQVYPVLAALLAARTDLDAATLTRSADRLRTVPPTITGKLEK